MSLEKFLKKKSGISRTGRGLLAGMALAMGVTAMSNSALADNSSADMSSVDSVSISDTVSSSMDSDDGRVDDGKIKIMSGDNLSKIAQDYCTVDGYDGFKLGADNGLSRSQANNINPGDVFDLSGCMTVDTDNTSSGMSTTQTVDSSSSLDNVIFTDDFSNIKIGESSVSSGVNYLDDVKVSFTPNVNNSGVNVDLNLDSGGVGNDNVVSNERFATITSSVNSLSRVIQEYCPAYEVTDYDKLFQFNKENFDGFNLGTTRENGYQVVVGQKVMLPNDCFITNDLESDTVNNIVASNDNGSLVSDDSSENGSDVVEASNDNEVLVSEDERQQNLENMLFDFSVSGKMSNGDLSFSNDYTPIASNSIGMFDDKGSLIDVKLFNDIYSDSLNGKVRADVNERLGLENGFDMLMAGFGGEYVADEVVEDTDDGRRFATITKDVNSLSRVIQEYCPDYGVRNYDDLFQFNKDNFDDFNLGTTRENGYQVTVGQKIMLPDGCHIGNGSVLASNEVDNDNEVVEAKEIEEDVDTSGSSYLHYYHVTYGETLGQITKERCEEDYTYQELGAFNGLRAPYRLKVDQVLKLPQDSCPSSTVTGVVDLQLVENPLSNEEFEVLKTNFPISRRVIDYGDVLEKSSGELSFSDDVWFNRWLALTMDSDRIEEERRSRYGLEGDWVGKRFGGLADKLGYEIGYTAVGQEKTDSILLYWDHIVEVANQYDNVSPYLIAGKLATECGRIWCGSPTGPIGMGQMAADSFNPSGEENDLNPFNVYEVIDYGASRLSKNIRAYGYELGITEWNTGMGPILEVVNQARRLGVSLYSSNIENLKDSKGNYIISTEGRQYADIIRRHARLFEQNPLFNPENEHLRQERVYALENSNVIVDFRVGDEVIPSIDFDSYNPNEIESAVIGNRQLARSYIDMRERNMAASRGMSTSEQLSMNPMAYGSSSSRDILGMSGQIARVPSITIPDSPILDLSFNYENFYGSLEEPKVAYIFGEYR